MSARTRLAATAALLALGTAGAAHAGAPPSPYTSLTAFGDSLSDDGNVALALGEPQPMRFTTNPGLTTVEVVGRAFGITLAPSIAGGADYAWGGAGITNNSPGTPAAIPTETAQITGYLAANPRLDGRGLYSVFAGANDLFAAAVPAFLGLTSFDGANATLAAAGTQQGALVGRLRDAGAGTIIVFNLPDVGLTPQSQALGAANAAKITAMAQAYNDALAAALKANGRNVVPVNTFLLLREVVANPAAVGFTNVTTPACTVPDSLDCTPATLRAPDAASTYLFADSIHPTTAAHAIFGQVVVAELKAPSYVSLLAEAPLATAVTQRQAWSEELAHDGAGAGEPGLRVFGRLDYDGRSFDPAGYTGRAGDDGGAATVGVDWRLGAGSQSASLGAAFTAGRSHASFDDGSAKFTAQSYLVSVFGQARVGAGGYLQAAAGIGDLDFDDVARSFALGPARRGERGDTGGQQVTATLGGGWWFGASALRFGPYAQLQFERVTVNAFAEQGADSTAMTFGRQTRDELVEELGVRAEGAGWRTPLGEVGPYLALAYDHDGQAGQRFVQGGLVTMPGVFSAPGYAPAGDWGTAQVGLQAKVARRVTVYAGYQGRFADGSQSANGVTLGARAAF